MSNVVRDAEKIKILLLVNQRPLQENWLIIVIRNYIRNKIQGIQDENNA